MRLLHCRRFLNGEPDALLEFFEGSIPSYYILSHRWGDNELSYKDCIKGRNKTSAGYFKVYKYCQFALAQHARLLESRLEVADTFPGCFVWIDTCCIDKRSSAELSEAINSMWNYYSNAWECHVYLQDVHVVKEGHDKALDQLTSSRWFTRGWTLQELLAPRSVVFLYSDWTFLGQKCHHNQFPPPADIGLQNAISTITGIESSYLNDPLNISKASIAKRMSWASSRSTTRTEDEAYCLLGIFDVNIPLLYGEGSKAFRRLQEAILSSSTDHSLFAHEDTRYKGLLAHSPKSFRGAGNVMVPQTRDGGAWPHAMTNLGIELRIEAQKIDVVKEGFERHWGVSMDTRKVQEAYLITLNAHRDERGRNESRVPITMVLFTRDSISPQIYLRGSLEMMRRALENGELKISSERSEVKSFYVKP